jgi:hypothetical protein
MFVSGNEKKLFDFRGCYADTFGWNNYINKRCIILNVLLYLCTLFWVLDGIKIMMWNDRLL